MYAIRGKRSYIEKCAKGVAQKGIYLKEMSEIDLNIPTLYEQEYIVEILDKIALAIRLRKQEIQKLEELVSSRFVDLCYEGCKLVL